VNETVTVKEGDVISFGVKHILYVLRKSIGNSAFLQMILTCEDGLKIIRFTPILNNAENRRHQRLLVSDCAQKGTLVSVKNETETKLPIPVSAEHKNGAKLAKLQVWWLKTKTKFGRSLVIWTDSFIIIIIIIIIIIYLI